MSANELLAIKIAFVFGVVACFVAPLLLTVIALPFLVLGGTFWLGMQTAGKLGNSSVSRAKGILLLRWAGISLIGVGIASMGLFHDSAGIGLEFGSRLVVFGGSLAFAAFSFLAGFVRVAPSPATAS